MGPGLGPLKLGVLFVSEQDVSGFPEDELIQYQIKSNQCFLTTIEIPSSCPLPSYSLPDSVWLILPPKQKTSLQIPLQFLLEK